MFYAHENIQNNLELVEKNELPAIQIIVGTYCIISVPDFIQITVSRC